MLGELEILELRTCAESAERAIEQGRTQHIRRVIVVAETSSTQDTAAAVAGSETGLLVVAGRQTAARGRLGRVWIQGGGLGVAATLTLTVLEPHRQHLSLAAGVAVARAIEDVLAREPASAQVKLGIRWPNDVVETARGRKLAGILIEARSVPGQTEPLFLIGVGINVGQSDADWPDELANRAVSLGQLRSTATRADLLAVLIHRLDESLQAAFETSRHADLLTAWKQRDTLLGTRAVFALGSARMAGTVESIDPALEITLRQADGLLLRLPAATTSLLRPSAHPELPRLP